MPHRTLAVLVLLAFIVAGCVGSAPPPTATPPPAQPSRPAATPTGAPGAPTPRPTPLISSEPPVIGVGEPVVHVFLWGRPDTTERDLRLARAAGFTWVKQRFEWRFIEADANDQFGWDEPDRIVNAVNQAGLKLLARVDNQPRWARKDGLFPGAGPPDNLQDWADFLTALATRYRGRIQAYQLWNEPNLDREWGNRRPSAKEYAELLRVGYQAIKRADPNAYVISAGLSPTTNQSDQAWPDVLYLDELYQAGAKPYFDILGVHAAGFRSEPEEDPAVVAHDRARTNEDPSPVERRRVYAFRHVEDLRAVMVKHGDAEKTVAILEMGWTSDTRPDSPYAWHSVSEEEKADYLVRAFKWARAHWAPWMGLMTVIYLPDPAWTPKDEQYHWSITNGDGTPRPAYQALKAYLTQ